MGTKHDMTTRFPIFSKERARSADEHGQIRETGDTIYSKRVSISTHIDVSVDTEGRTTCLRFWTNTGMVSPCLSDDYSLGRGPYQCSEEEFNAVMMKAWTFMDHLRAEPSQDIAEIQWARYIAARMMEAREVRESEDIRADREELSRLLLADREQGDE